MKLKGTPIPGYRRDKSGKLVKIVKQLDASKQIAQRTSKKVRVKRKIDP